MKPRAVIPRATYRLQFHRGFTLRDALGCVPYLEALGVSHVYASPLLLARPGSPHGYDVCDPGRINPDLGTEADLAAFVAALRQRRMGLVLDIVPNHLATAPENPWWWDVLKHGRHSRFADYFDIDWDSPDPDLRGKVLLPVLADEYERVLGRGELTVGCENAEVTVRYFDHRFPASPESILVPGKFLHEAVADFNADRAALARFLDQQHYRLADWREGDTRLNYRRFFTITHLAGVRVELPQVFTDTHNQLLAWHQRGLLDGLRVDHPDGLLNPRDYLQRLRRAASGAWIVVEKILEPGEALPRDWPVAGTTGYDFLNRVGGLFIDPAGATPLTDFYATFTGEPTDYAALVGEKKRWILRHHLVAEVNRLVRLLAALLTRHAPRRTFSPERLREALVELIAAFPVYRTYLEPERKTASRVDRARVAEALAQAGHAQASRTAEPRLRARVGNPQGRHDEAGFGAGGPFGEDAAAFRTVLAFLGDLLRLRVRGELAAEFVWRFQQLTGPAMAKGKEDTLFYCYSRFIALNEVGGDPGAFGGTLEDFHGAGRQTHQRWPATLLATSTHDTKRSEDVRARLALLSEIPEAWAAAVRRWSAHNERYRRRGRPDRNVEYFYYQTLVGAWPLPLDRALACLEKVVREAKQHTDWSCQNPAYEAALRRFVTATLGDGEFTADLARFVAPLLGPGRVNSLAQTLLKLTAPGVPDVYQGTELWDLSLVDPDNRRPVDFALRQQLLAGLPPRVAAGDTRAVLRELWRRSADGRLKLLVIQRALGFRRRHVRLFRHGGYLPLRSTGAQAAHLCAFARTLPGTTALVVVPRLVLGLLAGRDHPPLGPEVWKDTRLVLPRTLAGRPFRHVFTGQCLHPSPAGAQTALRLAEVFEQFPVALLEPAGGRLRTRRHRTPTLARRASNPTESSAS